MCELKRAEENDYQQLTDLAYQSEAYWGNDKVYMSKFLEFYQVTREFIRDNPTMVLVEKDIILGFYGIIIKEGTAALEYFYIKPDYIGHGYGSMLWGYLKQHCTRLGIRELQFVTSPEAKDFYIKMGAEVCGEVESFLKQGRIIPQLIYKI